MVSIVSIIYTVNEFKAKPGKIFRDLEKGKVVVITQGGRLWAKLSPVQHLSEEERKDTLPLSSLREFLGHRPKLREATEEDFQSVKTMWRMPVLGSDESDHKREE